MLSGVVTKSSTLMIWLTMRNRIVIWKGSLDGVWGKRAGRQWLIHGVLWCDYQQGPELIGSVFHLILTL
jgi:hypothetical protein